MRQLTIVALATASVALAIASVSCGSAAQPAIPDVVAMERAALDRWGKGDPSGYLEIMANEVTASIRCRTSGWTASIR
jgi:hypothetical protein